MAPAQQMAHARYWNKASGHMETKQAMQHYQRHPVPPGHQVAGTKHTTVTHPAPPQRRPEPDLVHMTRPQLFDLAHKLVSQEQQAGRLPFEQAEKRLEGQEGATRANTERLATQGNQAGAALVASQQQAGATGEQRAREAQTQAVMPTEVQQANAARGVAPTEQGSRQEALLKALGQGGVNQAANARAAGEKWAQSQAGAYQQAGTAAVAAVGTRFGNERGKNREELADYISKTAGAEPKLRLDLLSEQGKLKEAASANRMRALELGLKDTQARERTAATLAGQKSTARTAAAALAASREEGAASRKLDWAHLTEAERHNHATEAAANAKAALDALNKKQGKLTAHQEAANGEVSAAFHLLHQGIAEKVAKGEAGKKVSKKQNAKANREVQIQIRNQLPAGKAGELIAKDPVMIQAGQELWYHHKISKATRAAMGRKGINIGYDQDIYNAVSGGAY